MLRIIFYAVVLLSSCTNNKENSLGFLLDENDNLPSDKIQSIVRNFTFYVVYSKRPDSLEYTRILGMQKQGDKQFWYMISLIESEYIPSQSALVDYTITKQVSEPEATIFLKKLTQYNLFRLPRGKSLTEDCSLVLYGKRQYPENSDLIYHWFHIRSDSIVLNREYYDPESKYQNCPDKKAWKNVLLIDSLFTNAWPRLPKNRNLKDEEAY